MCIWLHAHMCRHGRAFHRHINARGERAGALVRAFSHLCGSRPQAPFNQERSVAAAGNFMWHCLLAAPIALSELLRTREECCVTVCRRRVPVVEEAHPVLVGLLRPRKLVRHHAVVVCQGREPRSLCHFLRLSMHRRAVPRPSTHHGQDLFARNHPGVLPCRFPRL